MSIHNNGANYNRKLTPKMSFYKNDNDRKKSAPRMILTAVEVQNTNIRGIIRDQLVNLEDKDLDYIFQQSHKAYMQIRLEKVLLEIENNWTKEEKLEILHPEKKAIS